MNVSKSWICKLNFFMLVILSIIVYVLKLTNKYQPVWIKSMPIHWHQFNPYLTTLHKKYYDTNICYYTLLLYKSKNLPNPYWFPFFNLSYIRNSALYFYELRLKRDFFFLYVIDWIMFHKFRQVSICREFWCIFTKF